MEVGEGEEGDRRRKEQEELGEPPLQEQQVWRKRASRCCCQEQLPIKFSNTELNTLSAVVSMQDCFFFSSRAVDLEYFDPNSFFMQEKGQHTLGFQTNPVVWNLRT